MDSNKNRLSQIFTPDYIAEFMVKNIHRDTDGKLDIEYDDVAV